MKRYKNHILPGLPVTLGVTLGWLGFMVLFPIAAMLAGAFSIPIDELLALLSRPAALSSFFLTLRYALLAASVNSILGFVLAWTLSRYRFVGNRFLEALIDIPFALPGSVGGIALASVFGKNGIVGSVFALFDVNLVYNQFGIFLGLMFVTLPFSVRTVQPLIKQLDRNEEEAARLLGAKPWQVFLKIQAPVLVPGVLSGFILTFARSLGEYGTVIFVAGNIPLKSEVISRYIYNKIDQYDLDGAMATAAMLLLVSFVLLFAMNSLQRLFVRRS